MVRSLQAEGCLTQASRNFGTNGFKMATENAGACGDMMVEMEMDFEEEDLATSSIADTKFDMVIGHIEDIIMDFGFQEMQNDFMEKYYHEFEDTEECKFVYTDIHQEYVNLIEKYLERELCSRMEDFSMEDFQKQLLERKEELDGEVFEMLLTFGDFVAFKEMFIDYRNAKEGVTADLSMGITVTPFNDSQVAQLGISPAPFNQ